MVMRKVSKEGGVEESGQYIDPGRVLYRHVALWCDLLDLTQFMLIFPSRCEVFQAHVIFII